MNPVIQRISKPGGVLLLINVEVIDPQRFGEYVKGHLPTISQFGGKIIFQSSRTRPLEGEWEARDILVIHQWESQEQLMKWYHSEEYAPWKALRQTAARVNATICEQMT